MRRLGDGLDDSGVLDGKQSFRHNHVEENRQYQRGCSDEKRCCLPLQHPLQRAPVKGHYTIEQTLRGQVKAASILLGLPFEQPRAHHRRKGERDYCRKQNGHTERDRELAEQPANNVAHEEQRNQHRDQ